MDIGDDISCVASFTNSTLIICSPVPIGEAAIGIAFEVSGCFIVVGDCVWNPLDKLMLHESLLQILGIVIFRNMSLATINLLLEN